MDPPLPAKLATNDLDARTEVGGTSNDGVAGRYWARFVLPCTAKRVMLCVAKHAALLPCERCDGHEQDHKHGNKEYEFH